MPGVGPEDVVLTADGRVIAGIADGRILRIDPTDDSVTILADTGGRPLGLHVDPDGTVLICDAERGVLQLSDGQLDVVVDSVDGAPLPFASNIIRDTDGSIYFSSSSRRYSLADYMGDLLEHSGTGRLFRRDPSGTVETLLDGLYFANGVALAADGSCVLVAETGAYQVTRYWLTGPLAGSHDVLIDNLPGFPDNIALGSDGLIWITLPGARDPMLDRLFPLPGVLRKLVWALPERMRIKAAPTVWVLAVDLNGKIVHDLQIEGTNFAMVTGVAERDGTLYLGSLSESAIGITQIP
ncbi:SMP-30/gluconolactonase/LRE family protein [Nocardia panacis]|uniref:SMP-30/gluconolactonase/LRE family protein n=1 Tax=Nocardia panacis TaxID=2340916 RepID=A0A3A4KGN6_9NOCA|nr:SMP-30/gluconolactonase/LRE family protein [Nocardia panacis]